MMVQLTRLSAPIREDGKSSKDRLRKRAPRRRHYRVLNLSRFRSFNPRTKRLVGLLCRGSLFGSRRATGKSANGQTSSAIRPNHDLAAWPAAAGNGGTEYRGVASAGGIYASQQEHERADVVRAVRQKPLGATWSVNMKRLLLAVGLVFVVGDAYAITRYNSISMSCAKVQETILRDGAAIMRWRSARNGMQLYGRYVADGSFCESSTLPEWQSIPAGIPETAPFWNAGTTTWMTKFSCSADRKRRDRIAVGFSKT